MKKTGLSSDSPIFLAEAEGGKSFAYALFPWSSFAKPMTKVKVLTLVSHYNITRTPLLVSLLYCVKGGQKRYFGEFSY